MSQEGKVIVASCILFTFSPSFLSNKLKQVFIFEILLMLEEQTHTHAQTKTNKQTKKYPRKSL